MGEKKVVDWTALVAWCDSNDIPKSTRGDLYTIMAKADAQHERIVAGLEARLTEAHDLVCECKKKIVAYRDHVSNEYTGGPTLQTLMPRIDAFLAQTAEENERDGHGRMGERS